MIADDDDNGDDDDDDDDAEDAQHEDADDGGDDDDDDDVDHADAHTDDGYNDKDDLYVKLMLQGSMKNAYMLFDSLREISFSQLKGYCVTGVSEPCLITDRINIASSPSVRGPLLASLLLPRHSRASPQRDSASQDGRRGACQPSCRGRHR